MITGLTIVAYIYLFIRGEHRVIVFGWQTVLTFGDLISVFLLVQFTNVLLFNLFPSLNSVKAAEINSVTLLIRHPDQLLVIFMYRY